MREQTTATSGDLRLCCTISISVQIVVISRIFNMSSLSISSSAAADVSRDIK